MTDSQIREMVAFYNSAQTQFELNSFLSQVSEYFSKNPRLNFGSQSIIHSIKQRLKDPNHLEDKLSRKFKDKGLTPDSLFSRVTDLAGVRVLHLYQDQFPVIHEEILKKVRFVEDWAFVEEPKAYTWDPESQKMYEDLRISTELRDTYYTSVHYVVKPHNDKNPVCCEIQIRTLFEEIWGEVDHSINYPHATASIACREQLRVLSKLVSTGTRLTDSIFRSYLEHIKISTSETVSKDH